MKNRDLAYTAIYITLFTVMEYLGTVLNLFQMPNGGSVSVSEIALLIGVYRLGFKKGLYILVGAIIMMFLSKPLYIVNFGQYLLDYVIAYMCYILAAYIKPNSSFYKIILILFFINFIRFISHNISGLLFFSEAYTDNLVWGVSVYNASYMVPNLIITTILFVQFKPLIDKVSKKR